MAPTKIAYAYPANIEGTVFSVTYSDDAAMDRDVNGFYLERLARSGYRDEVAACPANHAYVLAATRSGHLITPLSHCRKCGQPINEAFPADDSGQYHPRCAREHASSTEAR